MATRKPKSAKGKSPPKGKATGPAKPKASAAKDAKGKAKAAPVRQPKSSWSERFWHALTGKAMEREAVAHQHDLERQARREREAKAEEEARVAAEAAAKKTAKEQAAAERRKEAKSRRDMLRIAKEEDARLKREAHEAALRARAEERRQAKEAEERAAAEAAAEVERKKAEAAEKRRLAREAKAEEARKAKEAARRAEAEAAAEAKRKAAEQAAEAERKKAEAAEKRRLARQAKAEEARQAKLEAERKAAEQAAEAQRKKEEAAEKRRLAREAKADEARQAKLEAERKAAEQAAEAQRKKEEAAEKRRLARESKSTQAEPEKDDEAEAPTGAAERMAAELARRRSQPIVIDADEAQEAVPRLPKRKADAATPLVTEAAPAAKAPEAPRGLSLPESFILLALETRWDERSEKVGPGQPAAALAGAILLELAMRGRVQVRRDRFLLTGDPLDDAALEDAVTILADLQDEPSVRCLGKLAEHNPDLLIPFKDRLKARGYIDHAHWKHLGMLRRCQVALTDAEAQERLRNKLRRAIAGGGTPDAPTILALGLLDAAGLFSTVVPPGAADYNRKRLNGLLSGRDVMGYQVDKQLKGLQEVAVRGVLDAVRTLSR